MNSFRLYLILTLTGGCYPSMQCRWYPSMACSRPPGEGAIPACIAGGIPACLAAGLQGGLLPGGSAPGGWVCSGGVGLLRGVCAPGWGWGCYGVLRGAAGGGWWRPPGTATAAGILLECILVSKNFYFCKNFTHILKYFDVVKNFTNVCWCANQGSHSEWKTWEVGRHFPVMEKSGNFEQTGKVGGNYTKILENLGNSGCCLLFLVIFKWTVYYLLKWIKLRNQTINKYWKMEKNTGKIREFC